MAKGEIHSFTVHKGLDRCVIHDLNVIMAVNCLISKLGAVFIITCYRLKWHR